MVRDREEPLRTGMVKWEQERRISAKRRLVGSSGHGLGRDGNANAGANGLSAYLSFPFEDKSIDLVGDLADLPRSSNIVRKVPFENTFQIQEKGTGY